MASGRLTVVHSSLLRWITALMTESRSWLQLEAKSGGSCSGLGLTNVLTIRLLVVILHFGGNTRLIRRSALSSPPSFYSHTALLSLGSLTLPPKQRRGPWQRSLVYLCNLPRNHTVWHFSPLLMKHHSVLKDICGNTITVRRNGCFVTQQQTQKRRKKTQKTLMPHSDLSDRIQ